MQLNLSDAILVLKKTPRTLDLMLRDLPEEWLHATEGKDTWSCYSVVGHLIHGEITDWIPRIRIILEHGADRPFDPFDRLAQFREDETKPIGQLLDRFHDLRNQNLSLLTDMRLQPEHLARAGTHPDLGQVTLAQLIAAWVVHDLSHLSQIERVMAKQYSTEVGPWKRYMSILNR